MPRNFTLFVTVIVIMLLLLLLLLLTDFENWVKGR